jgi:hypothetical protein
MLLPLQHLTALSVVSYPEINEAGARALAQLTGLRQLSVQHMELQPTAMERFVALTNLTALECSYQRKLLSYMHPDEFKTLHAVSEVGGTTTQCALCDRLAVLGCRMSVCLMPEVLTVVGGSCSHLPSPCVCVWITVFDRRYVCCWQAQL